MQLSSILAILPIAAVALAAPGKPSKPSKPEKPAAPHSPQYNFCGNGVTPYCCNNEAAYGGSASCTALDQSGNCDTTIVCCNAQDSVQVCAGNINIQSGWGSGFL